MHQLADDQRAVVLISHDIDEILEHCNAVTVLRDGEIVGELTQNDLARANIGDTIRYMMIGREMTGDYYRGDYDPGCGEEALLTFENISFGAIQGFNLKIHAGEIVGSGGLSGCGIDVYKRQVPVSFHKTYTELFRLVVDSTLQKSKRL